MKDTRKRKTKKGDFGYFNSEKKRRLLITAGLFSLPLLIFFVAWAVNGTRMTVWTVLTVVGCLPGCKSMVSLIMILLRHPMAYLAEQSQKIIRKNGYKVDVKILKDLKPYLERLDSMNEHKESLRNGIKFTPDERYPDLSREELIKHTILAICL